MRSLIDRISDAAGAVAAANRARTFESALEEFVFSLQTVPDYPAAEISDEGFARLNALSERVIADIEHRLDGTALDEARRARFAESVYDIRRAIEDAFTWRKHYLRR